MTPSSRGVTFRSLFVGTIAVIAACALTPLNDYTTYAEASLSAGFFPLIAVLILFVLVVGINAPLHRWLPRHALRSNELAVVLLMTMVACSIPNWGLMRFLIPMPVAPFHLGAADETFWKGFIGMGLPKWLFPVESVADGRTDPGAVWFYTRVPEGDSMPWRAWVVPLLAWGVFVAAMFATLVAMARLVLDQWAVNERLPFPLVQVQTALIEAPEAGRALNALFRSRTLWIALGAVFAIDMLIGLNAYDARWPAIPLKYDLTGIFSEEPLFFLREETKKAMVSFTIVGVTYFIRSRAAFSLWAIYLLCNGVDVYHGMRQGEMPEGAWQDQHLGACAAFVLAILWIGRQHWARVLKSAFRRDGVDRLYRNTFWIAMLGIVGMLGWLLFMGVSFWVAALIVVFILTAHLIVARVVAETGLPFYRCGIAPSQIYRMFSAEALGARDVYFAGVFNVLGPIGSRDSVTTFTQHGLAVCDNVEEGTSQRRGLGRVIAWSLLVGCLVAAPVTLWCQYSFPTPSAMETKPARNFFGADYVQKRDVANPFTNHARGRLEPRQYSGALHISIGFGVTTLLEFASLRWAAWPLLPVGYVASHGAFIENAWFSIFIGWLAQRIVVRLGGASLFQRARPIFIGIIFGEALAAGTWLLVNAALVMNGYEGKSVSFLL
ncbi:MAG: DUF6785 family protein [Tepidisphaeraceae bacterium]